MIEISWKKILGFFIVMGFFLLSFIEMASSERTVKTVEIPFGYVSQPIADQWYSKDIILNSPDGISNIISIEVVLKGDFKANTKVYIEIDNHKCKEVYWSIPNQDVADYTVKFDCSNLVDGKTGGTYTAKIKTDKVAQNIYASLRFTYYNDPELNLKQVYETVKAKLGMHGTEYVIGDNAIVFLQLYENNTPINDGTCLLDVFYPDKTQWKDNTPMIYLSGSDGLYYYDLEIPNQLGVYMVSASCSYRVEEGDDETANAFDIEEGTEYSGYYTDTWTSNNYRHYLRESYTGSAPDLVAYYNFTGLTENDTMIELDIHLEYQWEYQEDEDWYPSNEDANMEIYNFTDDSWFLIPQNITGATYDTYWDYGLTNSVDNFIDNGVVMIQFHDTQDDYWLDYLKIDHLYITPKYQISEVWDRIRGSGEMHVSSGNVSAVALVENVSVVANVSYVAEVGTLPSNGTSISFAGGTEYVSNESGLFVIQFMRTIAGNPSPINNGECNATFYYPNKSIWLNFVGFTYLSGSNGLYFYEETIPYIEGIYTIDGKCTRGGITAYDSHTFHVSNRTIDVLTNYNILMNHTIMDKLYLMQDELMSLNDTILAETNFTLLELLMNSSFEKTWENQTKIYNLLSEVNISVGSVSFNLLSLRSFIEVMNQTMINKLYLIQDEITSVNDTVLSHNNTVMWKLFMIQDDIADINISIGNLSINVTIPTEMNVTNKSIIEVSEEIIIKMLEHARILNDRIVNFHNNEYCIDNDTLRHNITYEYCIGEKCRWLSDIMDEECIYGCDWERNKCKESPLTKNVIVGVIFIVMLALIAFFLF